MLGRVLHLRAAGVRQLLALPPLAVMAWACVTWWPHLRNEFFVIIGSRNEEGAWYGFWSGFAGGTRPIEWVIIGALIYWHNNCHQPWCPRWGRYPAAGGVFRLCRHHHPDLEGSRPYAELIRRLHAEHKGRSS